MLAHRMISPKRTCSKRRAVLRQQRWSVRRRPLDQVIGNQMPSSTVFVRVYEAGAMHGSLRDCATVTGEMRAVGCGTLRRLGTEKACCLLCTVYVVRR